MIFLKRRCFNILIMIQLDKLIMTHYILYFICYIIKISRILIEVLWRLIRQEVLMIRVVE